MKPVQMPLAQSLVTLVCEWCAAGERMQQYGPIYADGWREIRAWSDMFFIICPRCVAERLPE